MKNVINNKINKITCGDCRYGIDVNENGLVKLCDNPYLKTYGKNVKHGHRFSCGYGVLYCAINLKKEMLCVMNPQM